MSQHSINNDWFTEAFDALYPIVYSHRSIDAAAPEVHFAAQVLGIRDGSRLLDLCCGTGRHIHHLSKFRASLYGLDYSAELLRKAQELVGDRASLVRGDMRTIPFVDSFDVIVNFFTSFGYFLDMDENLAVLHGIKSALKPGGRLFMDHINMQAVRTTLQPHSQRAVGHYAIDEKRWIDDNTQRVNKRTRITGPHGDMQEISESVRLFRPDEISGYMAEAGLHVEAIYGDYEGNALTAEAPRMILVATA